MSDYKDKDVEVFEDEKHILLDHDYDGIRELNHPLPGWWVVTFILTLVFAVPYWANLTFFGGETIEEELKSDMDKYSAAQAKFNQEQGGFSMDKYNAIIAGPKIEKIAKKTYRRKCKACHGAAGEGGVGPNLTDKYWLHGNGSMETVYNTINKGVPDKGMQAWGDTLGEKKMYAVLKYVMELQGTNPPNAKEPQGEEYP